MAEVTRKQPFDIPGYRMVRWLGRGGMADVYLAIQLSLGRPVAIKVLAAERTPSDDDVTRFEQEARIIARLDHPHIVGIFDVGRTSTGQLYYTMPHMPNGHLAGRDLAHDEGAVIAVVRALCQALAYAHEQGIVHRDVKPENVLFDKLDRPLLADFGIAISSAGDTRLTREGATLGSVAYMSPEQARGRPLDGRSDIYSLGVVAYECLVGKLPFSGDDSVAVALAHVEQQAPNLPSARIFWQSFIDKAMAKDPDARFQTASEMLEALETLEKRIAMIEPLRAVATTLAGVPEQLERNLNAPVRARPWAALVVVALGLVVLSAIALQLRSPRSENAAATPASIETSAAEAAALAINASTREPVTAVAPAADVVTESRRSPTVRVVEATSATIDAKKTDANANPGTSPGGDVAAVKAPLRVGTPLRERGAPETIVLLPATPAAGKKAAGAGMALGRYEVTRREYAEFARATGRAAAACRQPKRPWSALEKLDWRNPGFVQDDRHPVVCVSWADANAYAQWISARTHHKYRLPAQNEWLVAARSAQGNDICKSGNVSDESSRSILHLFGRFDCNDGFAQTAPVGRFAPTRLGIFDLLGNASEWMRDCAGNAGGDNVPCHQRIFRGMSWRDGTDSRNLDLVGTANEDVGFTTVGFRVAREVEPGDG